MTPHYFSRRRLLVYLLPIAVGLGGIAISRLLDSPLARMLVVLISVGVPLFAGGNLLARYRASNLERLLLLGGVVLLVFGAALSVSGLSEALDQENSVSDFVIHASRTLGIGSVLVGLFAVLYSVARTGQDIEAIGERFRHLADHITEGFILSTSDGVIFQVNNQFLHMFDLEQEKVVGQNAMMLARRLNAGPVEEHIAKRAKGIASEYEVTWSVHGEERRFWFSGTPIYDQGGRLTATLATVRDITEHHRLSKRVERYAESLQELVEEQTTKLQQSEERFRQLLLSMYEGFLTVDASNRIRFANERICRMLRLNREALVNTTVFDYVDGEGRVRLLNLLAQGAAAQGSGSRQEMNFVTAAGEEAPAMVAVAYVRETADVEPIYSLVVTSVADQKAMQHQLELRARELERANQELLSHDRAKDAFLSNVSHELRTPLSTIQGYVEMLESGSLGMMDGAQTGALKVMGRNVDRLVGLINEMIEFSRMEIRGVQVNSRIFYADRLVRDAVASIHPQSLARDISVNVFAEDDLPPAWGDRDKLAQVLGILLNNAVKFTESGGLIQVNTSCRDGALLLSVADTGIGIAPKDQEKVFTKFFQVDRSKTRRYEGTGIGLSIAKNVVEAHGGSIELSSDPDKGSTFTIVLPDALFNLDLSPNAEDGLDHKRLLVVDEHGDFGRAVQEALRSSCMECRLVPNGYEASREAEEWAPDVVLINEASSSEASGTAAVNLLRQQPQTETVPIVVTAVEYSDSLQQLRGMTHNVHVLSKPFTAQDLSDRLRQAALGELPAVEEDVPADETRHESWPQVLVVDPDPGMLEWVATALHRRNIACWCASSPQKARALVAQRVPAVIFVDVDVPGAKVSEHVAFFDQEEATRHVPVHVMTGAPKDAEPWAGVSGVLHKPFSADEMARIVRETVAKEAASAL